MNKRYSLRRRSIPACAGEPDRTNNAYYPQWVYPRVCGGTGWLMRSSIAA